MTNVLLLLVTLLLAFALVVLSCRFAGKTGLFAANVLLTVLANIEVVVIIRAFGIEQTLGNVLFAATFIISDVISEIYGKKEAQRSVLMSLCASAFFLLLTLVWTHYIPAESDWAMPAVRTIFSITPRLMLASLSVYAVSQLLDVWLYQRCWDFTAARSGRRESHLWLRNNFSTIISQAINTVLYTLLAFGGMYEWSTIWQIMLSSFIIYTVLSLLGTPVVYICRKCAPKNE
ncbi:MAG: queuosine precursor transporter [Bacteroidales bacterium]|nr:queuosine precursor transporter [Candidatus Equibacterium intestinale]